LGSYNKLAEFKAQIINDFVREKGVTSVIEYGCGDGNQLALSEYPSYIGFDVSETAVELCRKLFKEDQTKRFSLLEHYSGQVADLTLSLDVIYHLLEDETFNDYMAKLFDTALRYVVIYSSNTNETVSPAAAHVKHRKFTDWIEANRPEWVLMRHIPNKYPYRGRDEDGSFADFFVYSK
jgi:SAM-dependent methyltransferase